MTSVPACIIVVPCFDEEHRLPASDFSRFIGQHDDVGLLFVNDGSHDGTLQLLQALCRHPSGRLSLLDLPSNRGKGEAVRLGIREAMRRGARLVGYWDADLATPLEAISRFREVLARQADCQIVVGTRIPLLGRGIQRRVSRRILATVFSWAASRALGTRVLDTQCGAKLMRVNSASRWAFQYPFLSRWIFDVELLARLNRAWGCSGRLAISQRVYEFVLEDWREVPGSKLKARDYVRAAWELAAIGLGWQRHANVWRSAPPPAPEALLALPTE